MVGIGVRELKAHLSEYLKRVQAGERLTVTDHGRPVAILSPIETAASLGWAHTMVAEGRARWGGGKPLGLRPRIQSRGPLASQMVSEDRE
jgi:prevent-host-death family protein